MKKKVFVCFALAVGLIMGVIPSTQASAKEGNVIVAPRIADTAEINFEEDHSVAAFSMHGEECFALSQQFFDYEAAIEAIESGAIAPLSLDNLPTEADMDSAYTFADTQGAEEDVVLSGVSVHANCAHNYEAGVLTGHKKNDDGSCDVVSYDSIRCSKCKQIWVLDVIGSAHYRVCPH